MSNFETLILLADNLVRAIDLAFLARRERMSSERYCHTPGVVVIVVVVVVVDNFRLKFLFINLSQVKVSVY